MDTTVVRPRAGRLTSLGAGLCVLIVLGSAVHLTQGTSSTSALDVLELLFGNGSGSIAAVVVESRLPRLLAALLVGAALGVAGAVLQSVARNIMASPDTLAVNAGAHLAIVTVAAFGLSVPLLGVGPASRSPAGSAPRCWCSRCPATAARESCGSCSPAPRSHSR